MDKVKVPRGYPMEKKNVPETAKKVPKGFQKRPENVPGRYQRGTRSTSGFRAYLQMVDSNKKTSSYFSPKADPTLPTLF